MAGQPSRIIVNTGDGKGKSSSAFGVMGRGWARRWRVVAWADAAEKLRSGD